MEGKGRTTGISERIARYVGLLAKLNLPVGDWRKGEVQMVVDPVAIEKHEAKMKEQYRLLRIAKGSDEPREEWANIGILDEDQYLIHLRDAVLFPPRAGETEPTLGTYVRILYRNQVEGNSGVACIAVDEQNNIILNRSYRHSVRRWVLEAQGTVAKKGETMEETIARCVRDEIGRPIVEIKKMTSDGYLADRGFLGGLIPLYFVRVGAVSTGIVDPSVAEHVVLGKEEFQKAVCTGVYELHGIPHLFNCGNTNTAFLLAQLNTFF